MDAWIFLAMQVLLALVGASVVIIDLMLAGYAAPGVVRLHQRVLIVAGAATGVGTLHAGVVGNVALGALLALVSCLLLVLLVPSRRERDRREMSDDRLRTRTWLRGLVEYGYDLRDSVSDWGELDHGPRQRERDADRK